MTLDSKQCTIWNMYGPAETTVISTFHFLSAKDHTRDVPIGLPLPNYQCLIKDDFLQDVIINQEGELFVGGVGVFAGYLGQDDLTAKVLVEIDGEMFYRTGDLVRLDNDGLLHYIGRKDYQIKIHGQRIELGEIEQCLLNISFISGCVVTKWNDDHLVAYVQSSSVDQNQLREHCQSHLPSHMIPSKFIVFERFILNINGKIDRNRLPTPDSASHLFTSINYQSVQPSDELEICILSLWRQALSLSEISTNAHFFHIGGHSLLFVQLYHNYKIKFNIDISSISIAKFFDRPTIVDHAHLLRQLINNQQKDTNSSSVTVNTEGK